MNVNPTKLNILNSVKSLKYSDNVYSDYTFLIMSIDYPVYVFAFFFIKQIGDPQTVHALIKLAI